MNSAARRLGAAERSVKFEGEAKDSEMDTIKAAATKMETDNTAFTKVLKEALVLRLTSTSRSAEDLQQTFGVSEFKMSYPGKAGGDDTLRKKNDPVYDTASFAQCKWQVSNRLMLLASFLLSACLHSCPM